MRVAALAALGAAAALLAGCGSSAPKKASAPPPVIVTIAQSQQIPLTREFTGRLSAYREANVLARVPGVLLKRWYREGSEVTAGQPLFEIDPAPYRAALDAALAALAQAKANAVNAHITAQRDRVLIKTHLVSESQLDTDEAAERSTAALVQQAQANVESARINLGYTDVTSPIAGIAGEQQVTEGAMVGQGTPTLLTTVDQINPIYVNFNEPAAEQEQLTADAEAGLLTPAGPRAEVRLTLPNGQPYGQPGRLDFRAATVDPTTGTIALRAILPNANHQLLPGMFVNVRLAVGTAIHAFLLPQAAVQRNASGDPYVLTVSPDDTVVEKGVQTEGTSGADWIVSKGLVDGERVIVSGIQEARPGRKVTVSSLRSVPRPDR
jgi:membrane fusion protein (multidrug efflux system)